MHYVVKCPSCSAPLENEGAQIERCDFCGSRIVFSPNQTYTENSVEFGSLINQAYQLKEILRLVRSGNKIAAIKLYRETFGVGLAEAKDAVERLERGESVNFRNVNFQSFDPIKIDRQAAIRAAKMAGGATFFFIILGVGVALAGVGVAVYVIINATRNNPVALTPPIEVNVPNIPGLKQSSPNGKASYAAEILRFGGEGTGAGFFKDNRSIATDADGRIYTSDYAGGRVQVFDAGGKFQTQWMIDEEMPLLDLAADRKGNVFVSQKGEISKYEGASGKLLGKVSGRFMRDLTVGADGKIAATDGTSIYLFDSNLKQIAVWKDAAKQAGLTNLSRLAYNGLGEIYALGDNSKDIGKFSRDGKFADRFKTRGGWAQDIAVDGKNRILVSNVNNIDVYNADGNFVDSFETRQTFGMIFTDAGELLTASRPFVVKYKLND